MGGTAVATEARSRGEGLPSFSAGAEHSPTSASCGAAATGSLEAGPRNATDMKQILH